MRHAVAVFLTATSLALAANLLGAIHGTLPGQMPTRLVGNRLASEGAVLEWPVAPPIPWPRPTQVMEVQGWCSEYVNALSQNEGQTTHQMEVRRHGWPFRVLTEASRYWPWTDPRWQTDASPATGLQISWINLGVPALGAGAIAGGLVLTFGALRTRTRRRAGRCVRCDRPMHDHRRCPECGYDDPCRTPAPMRSLNVRSARDVRRATLNHLRIRITMTAFVAVTTLAVGAGLLGAVLGMQPGQKPTRLMRNEFASPGAVLEWPVEPPVPWPPPAQVAETQGRFAEQAVAVSVTDGQTTHQMEVTRYGWPLRVFTEARRGWPRDDPRWRTDAPAETGLQVSWINLGVPALGAGAIAGGLVLTFGALRTRTRRRAGRCVSCGHLLREQQRCPECGFVDAT